MVYLIFLSRVFHITRHLIIMWRHFAGMSAFNTNMAGEREGLTSLCRIASQALQQISDLEQPTDTPTRSVEQSENLPETLQNANRVSLFDELASRFPTFNSRTTSTKRSSSSQNKKGKNKGKGATRPSTDTPDSGKYSKVGRSPHQTVNRDLIIIPNPNTAVVPSHKSRVHLENLGLVIHEFPFNRSWDASTLWEQIRKQLPVASDFEYIKVSSILYIKFNIDLHLTCWMILYLAWFVMYFHPTWLPYHHSTFFWWF